MSDTYKTPSRFSDEESIAHYTVIVYKLNQDLNDGITCVGHYCMCRGKCTCRYKLKILEQIIQVHD